jgi:hypothetical protein
MQLEMLYMGHSKGDFEGTSYDNVLLSNGKRTGKVVNKTGKDSFNFLPENDKVICTFEPTINKQNNFSLSLVKIEKK